MTDDRYGTLIALLGQDELTDDEYADAEGLLRELYRFHIMNPAHHEGLNYSLWIRLHGKEYAMLESNTLGLATWSSATEKQENGIEPTGEFFRATAYTFHELMCFTPVTYDTDKFQQTVDAVYDGKNREYETWAAWKLTNRLFFGRELFPEVEPIARWCGHHTEFGVPILGRGEVGEDDG